MLEQRVITAMIFAGLVISAVIFLPTMLLAFVLAIIICVAAWEWAACAGFDASSYKISYVSVILLCLVACLKFMDNQWIILIVYCGFVWWLIAVFLVIRYQMNKNVNLSSRLLKAMIGGVILVPSWLSLILIHAKTSGVALVLFLFFLIWFADSAAYFSGRKFGSKKLASNVSPGKSWEGVYGALSISLLVGVSYVLYSEMQFTYAILFLVLVVLTVSFSILGDLVESMFKRMAGIKDSSHILPGHGGVLDRIDSLTSAAPVFLAGLWAMERVL
ncbi:MAG: phosphatidate cytidylyltransferase [Proteobacteria bacterium]|nr:phosphatidate cytidylyltransferase [Pseudomonadota bacterium]MCH8261912.1 phosphatidate cytidylyltransferase [Pseudomonadota bacterium]